MPVCPILRSIPKILEFDEEKAGGTGAAGFKHASASGLAGTHHFLASMGCPAHYSTLVVICI